MMEKYRKGIEIRLQGTYTNYKTVYHDQFHHIRHLTEMIPMPFHLVPPCQVSANILPMSVFVRPLLPRSDPLDPK